MSPLHVGSAPCVRKYSVGLISTDTTCCWYLDTGRRACGRGVQARLAALAARTACLLCMSAVRPASGNTPSASSRQTRRAAGTSTGSAGPAAGGFRLGRRPFRLLLRISPLRLQCALRAGMLCQSHLVRHDLLLVPRPGPPGLRPGGPGSAGGPSGCCCVSPLCDYSAPCVQECSVSLISSVTTCCWYLDRGCRACGRGVRAPPAALPVSAACAPYMAAMHPSCRSVLNVFVWICPQALWAGSAAWHSGILSGRLPKTSSRNCYYYILMYARSSYCYE